MKKILLSELSTVDKINLELGECIAKHLVFWTNKNLNVTKNMHNNMHIIWNYTSMCVHCVYAYVSCMYTYLYRYMKRQKVQEVMFIDIGIHI